MDRLSDYQRAFLHKYPYPQLFAVISWGCAATAWLANVLNRHPDLYCVHAANLTWQVLGDCERLDGARYLRVIGSQGHARGAAGDIHGISRHLVPECRQTFGEKFNAVVVVREPLARIHSQLALFGDFDGLRAWNVDYIDGVIERTGIKIAQEDYASRLFVHAANMLNAILEEPAVGKIYRSEDLTSEAATLRDFVHEITGGKVSASSEWLESALQTARINAHASRHAGAELEDWQMDAIRRVVDPRSWEIYESLGYARPEFVAGPAQTVESSV
ncbi:MAG TPA: hypothetical protein VGJ09_19870 [Bryobacteraceae bacterium]